jgi:hypothetical protein
MHSILSVSGLGITQTQSGFFITMTFKSHLESPAAAQNEKIQPRKMQQKVP